MRTDAEVVKLLQSSPCIMVHTSMCEELRKIVDGITCLLPVIESVRPGCKTGIEELCSLNNLIDKSRVLVQHCAQTSKLYAVIVGETTISKFELIQVAFKKSLIQIQCLVPESLATQIDKFLHSLMDVKFVLDFTEEQAAKALLSLLRQANATEDLEFEAYLIAASRLNLRSPKALLIEKRCIKKLHDKLKGSDTKKERILAYLMRLTKKFGKKVQQDTNENRDSVCELGEDPCARTDMHDMGINETTDMLTEAKLQDEVGENACQNVLSTEATPPEEFKCPISSRLMYDPVIIESGETYERMCLEKWFKDGHVTCPKTHRKLSNFCMIPNSSMKSLISNWCQKHDVSVQNPCSQSVLVASDILKSRSISSVNNVSALLLHGRAADYIFQSDYSSISILSSDVSYCFDSSNAKGVENLTDTNVQKFRWSKDYKNCHSFSNFNFDSYLAFLSDLSELPLDLHDKAVEDVKHLFDTDHDTCSLLLSNYFAEALMSFLKDAYNSSNIKAQKTGVQLLLAFLSNTRVKIPSLNDDASELLTHFLGSGLTLEVLKLIRLLSHHPDYQLSIVDSGICSSIINVLDSRGPEFLEPAVEILCQLSSFDEIRSQILASRCLPKLVSLLRDEQLSGGCLRILHDLCGTEDGSAAIAEADGCIDSIAELLDLGSHDEQADAVAILLSLCSRSSDNCLLVMKEGIIPSLVGISVNGNLQGKEDSLKLLHILRDLRKTGRLDSSTASVCSIPNPSPSSSSHPMAKKALSKAYGIFGRRMMFSSKPKSVPLF